MVIVCLSMSGGSDGLMGLHVTISTNSKEKWTIWRNFSYEFNF